MATAKSNTTSEEVRHSINSIYSQILRERAEEKAQKKAQKKEEKAQEEAAAESEEKDPIKMTRKERRKKAEDEWKAVVIGLTGDDLEYSSEGKKKRKKYRKWIDDDAPAEKKPKKAKKRNYRKEFEPELNMLRTLVTEQNRFTQSLQKRFDNAAGPATKDAMPLNKAMVDLAAAINAGRGNALGVLREIGSLKKTIATLYMDQMKMDAKNGGTSDGGDLALLGSNLAAARLGDLSMFSETVNSPAPSGAAPSIVPTQQNAADPFANIPEFDPSGWSPAGVDVDIQTMHENTPKTIVVQKNSEGAYRFAAINDDTGMEIQGYPVPNFDPNRMKVDEDAMTVHGDFNQIYPLRFV